MRNISERNELFVATLFVFTRQRNRLYQTIIYDQINDSGCIETLVQVSRKIMIIEYMSLNGFMLFSLHYQMIQLEFRKCLKQF